MKHSFKTFCLFFLVGITLSSCALPKFYGNGYYSTSKKENYESSYLKKTDKVNYNVVNLTQREIQRFKNKKLNTKLYSSTDSGIDTFIFGCFLFSDWFSSYVSLVNQFK